VPSFISTSIAVATELKVTPAQATNASRSKSPEQAKCPLPPEAGCNPASINALPVYTLHEMPSPILPWAFKITVADSGSFRYFVFNGACMSLKSSDFISLFISCLNKLSGHKMMRDLKQLIPGKFKNRSEYCSLAKA
jgi:hypothetical protein